MSEEMNLQLIEPPTSVSDGLLQFGKISINEEYRKKWNVHHLDDFVCLTRNSELLRPTLYRIGGLNNPKLNKDEYFMLLKHVEAFYSDEITKVKKDKPHLESLWCILDKNGNEKVEFRTFESAYLLKDSCIYSVGSHYYNIETGEHYGSGSTSMSSKDFLFLDNSYDKDPLKRGVMKINKKNGTWELFPDK